MSDEEWNYQDEGERIALVKRFEEMLESNASYFFDVDQFEVIVDFYSERNHVKKALHVLQYAQQLFPDSIQLLLREAQLFASSGKLSRAVPRLKNLLLFEPNNEEILMSLASVYSQLREHQKAIELLDHARKHADEELRDEIWIEMALEYENLNRFDKAIETLKEAIEVNPENETALYEINYCFDMADRYDEGALFFEGFIDEHPYSFPAWYNLGNAFQKLEKFPEALQAYDYCLVIEEDFAPAYANKANVLVKLERYAEAIAAYHELLEYDIPQANTFCYIGECHERIDQYDEADFYYKEALKIDEEFADAWVGLGVVADLRDMTDTALRYFRRAIEIEPENVDYLLLLAAAMRKVGMHSDAEELYVKIIQLDSNHPDAWLDHSDNAAQMGDYGRALDLIAEGMSQVEDPSELEYREVAYLYKAGKHKQAYTQLGLLLTRDAENSQSLLDYLPEIGEDAVVLQLMDLHKQ